MKARAGEKWSYENLNNFIKDPKTATPKTKMTFAGVKKDQARADVIAYLASLSDAPKPFPAP
jgi:cytochrome c